MAEKEILTRIQHKYDTQTNWEKATGFTPKKGELIIYSDIKKFKVGDGNSKLSALQFYDIDLSSYATKAYADQAEADALAAAKTYANGLATNIQTQLDKKAGDFSIEIYNGTGGNPKPVRFASFNYSTCNSENGIAAKISLVSGHGNGASYAFLEDAIIRVNYDGNVEVDNFKYYGAVTDVYDGTNRQYGDIFWLVDTTNKIVDFYCLMGQYARLYQTPWKRLTSSSGGAVTQHTSCTVYSSGTKVWGNNSDIALMSDLDAIPTPDVSGQIDAHDGDSNSHSDIRNSITSLQDTVNQLAASVVTVHSGSIAPASNLGEHGDLYLYTGD